jgi:CHASE3 domain sensor protein
MQPSGETTPQRRERRSAHHLGRRLLIVYALTVAVVAAVFSVALLVNSTGMLEFSTATARVAQGYRDLSALQESERNSSLRLLGYLSTGDDIALLDYRASLATRQGALDRVATAARDNVSRATVADLREQFATLDTATGRAIVLHDSGAERAALSGWQTDSTEALSRIERQINAIEQAQEVEQNEVFDAGQRSRVVTTLLTFLFATTTALLGLWIVHRVIQRITRPSRR